jgi:hypothetical protein
MHTGHDHDQHDGQDDGQHDGQARHNDQDRDQDGQRHRETYEVPALTPAGSFRRLTGLGGMGPRDTVGRHQLL